MQHIAVILKPYLDPILSGRKTVECRLTRQARDPYERIKPGERIYFKVSSGPFGATAIADRVLFEDGLTRRRIEQIRRAHDGSICGEPAFWRLKRGSRYCTLIWLRDVEPIDRGPKIPPLQGRGWLVLPKKESGTLHSPHLKQRGRVRLRSRPLRSPRSMRLHEALQLVDLLRNRGAQHS